MAENRPPTSVTDAQEAADKDYRQRVKRYTISMIIRVVCLLLAFVFTGWLRWVMLGGAVVLPYVAVVIANARNERLFHYEMASMQDSPAPMLSPDASRRPTTWQENGEDRSAASSADGAEAPAGEGPDGEGAHGDEPGDAYDEPVIIGEVLGDTLDEDRPDGRPARAEEEGDDDGR